MRNFLFIILISMVACEANKEENERPVLSPPEQAFALEENKDEYDIPDTKEGYLKAGKVLKNPVVKTGQNIEHGRLLYLDHCKHCHGENGDGQSIMVQKEKYPPPPDFRDQLKEITDGQVFHSLTYGKNLMPGNQKDLTMRERWLLVLYIKNLAAIDD